MELDKSRRKNPPSAQPEPVESEDLLTPTEEDIRADVWRRIHKFFTLVRKEDKEGRKRYQCLTCLPGKQRVIKCHKSTMFHLKKHILNCHKTLFDKYKAAAYCTADRGKKRPLTPGSLGGPEAKRQCTLSAWAAPGGGGGGTRDRISQAEHERNLVDMWIQCMLPVQVINKSFL